MNANQQTTLTTLAGRALTIAEITLATNRQDADLAASLSVGRTKKVSTPAGYGTVIDVLHILDGSATPVLLASFGLPKPSGSVTNDILSLLGLPLTVAAAAAGTAASAVIVDGTGLARITLTVGVTGSGAQVILDNLNIAAGQSVKLNSATIQHAA